jgi:(heptosyl)LPS beta-1,4-glucosyltransferase
VEITDLERTSKPKLSAVLIVEDEAHCLEKCLRSIRSIADEIIVIDSGSTDSTVAIARSFGAYVELSDWLGLGAQKNRALSRASGEWVLALDADEHLTRELAASIREAIASREPNANGFFIQFLATWCGKPVRFGDWRERSTFVYFVADSRDLVTILSMSESFVSRPTVLSTDS